VIGQLCAMATESRSFAFIHADNGSISRLIVHGDGTWLLRSFNETRHFDTQPAPWGESAAALAIPHHPGVP